MREPSTYWVSEPKDSSDAANDTHPELALCLGTGRFLRSVLVPALVGAGLHPILIQTRGRSFLEYMMMRMTTTPPPRRPNGRIGMYEVDTVLPDGSTKTEHIPCGGAFSLGCAQDKEATWSWISKQKSNCISVLGIGVTEAGLSSSNTQVMQDLYHLIWMLQQIGQPLRGKLCIINTDNVPNNASLIRSYMLDIARKNKDDKSGTMMETYLSTKVAFLDSMVDRITSQRDGSDGLVPKCEPVPAKALVLLDSDQDLPIGIKAQPGVVVRTKMEELNTDIGLKLRVANGTHTAIAHILALLRHVQTDILSTDHPGSLFMKYLDSLVEHQILPAAVASKTIAASQEDATSTWIDWRQRLMHPHFGLSTFFITQNGTAKGGIRWGPTVTDIITTTGKPTTVAMAFAYAALLRWLTPLPIPAHTSNGTGVLKGWFDGFDPATVTQTIKMDPSNNIFEYADGLRHSFQEGWYEYRCPLMVTVNDDNKGENKVSLPQLLQQCIGQRPDQYIMTIRAYLLAPEGGDLDPTLIASQPEFGSLVRAIASLLSEMVARQNGEEKGNSPILLLLHDLDANEVGGSIGWDSPCSAFNDYYRYLSELQQYGKVE